MSLKIRVSHIAMVLFVVSTLFDGAIWEGIGWLSVLYVFVKHNRPCRYARKREIILLSVILLVAIYVFLQMYLLKISATQAVRLYGITKTIIALPVMALCLTDYARQQDIVKEIVPVLIIVNIFMFAYLITGNEIFNVVHGTRNYIGAINIILFPYLWCFYPKRNKFTRYTYIIFIVLFSLFSGSRTTLATCMLTGFFLLLFEKSITKKVKYITIATTIGILLLVIVFCVGMTANFARGVSVLSSTHDQARIDLSVSAREQYNEYTTLQKRIGNGNNLVLWREAPPHNCFQEVLLCYGSYGLTGFITALLLLVIYCIKLGQENGKYLLLELGLAVLIGMVQPFITTGYLFQVCFSIVFISIDSKRIKKGIEYV